MREIVVLTEEPSAVPVFERMAEFLDPEQAYLTIIPHEGWSNLEKSLPRKLRGWTNPNSRFLVVRDNDSGDCAAHKKRIQGIAASANRADTTMVRIVCQELEAWFLGDRAAMDAAGVLPLADNPSSLRGPPDDVNKPSRALRDHLNGYPKVASAAAISRHMTPSENTSISFQHTFQAIKTLAGEI